jgi:hypothetical protein
MPWADNSCHVDASLELLFCMRTWLRRAAAGAGARREGLGLQPAGAVMERYADGAVTEDRPLLEPERNPGCLWAGSAWSRLRGVKSDPAALHAAVEAWLDARQRLHDLDPPAVPAAAALRAATEALTAARGAVRLVYALGCEQQVSGMNTALRPEVPGSGRCLQDRMLIRHRLGRAVRGRLALRRADWEDAPGQHLEALRTLAALLRDELRAAMCPCLLQAVLTPGEAAAAEAAERGGGGLGSGPRPGRLPQGPPLPRNRAARLLRCVQLGRGQAGVPAGGQGGSC